jgi:hypothetical protein
MMSYATRKSPRTDGGLGERHGFGPGRAESITRPTQHHRLPLRSILPGQIGTRRRRAALMTSPSPSSFSLCSMGLADALAGSQA